MNVNDIYILMLYIISKNQQGYLPPEKFNICINQGQRSYISYLLGTLQQYTPGRPIARVELGQNRTVRQRLSPVIYGYDLAIDTSGFSPYPGDYIQPDAMWSIYGASIYSHKRIRYVQQNQLDSFYNSTITPIATNPIYLIEDLGFQFYPENTYTARLHYVRDAPEIEWAFTQDVYGRAIYDAVNSKQPVWDSVAIFEIIVRALVMVGINLHAQQVVAYSNEIKNTGQ